MQKIVFITGCSSGIGTAMAMEFSKRGQVVYATARRPDVLSQLAAQGIHTLGLDVNDDASIAAAFATVAHDHGRVDIVVNNAGFGQIGAVIDLTRDDLRRQFETNVIAPVAVMRAALPLMQEAVAKNGHAVLANVGSIVGLFSMPFSGAYCASKAALHSLSDTMRMELAPLNIRVVAIQPGGVLSRFGEQAEATLRLPDDSLYHAIKAGILSRARAGQRGAMPAEEFVKPVVAALLASDPPLLVRYGKYSVMLPLLKRLLTTRGFDERLSRAFGLDRLNRR